MTSFTAVKSGDWDDPTVWGNLPGGDYPTKTTADDTANTGAYTVTYNIDNSSGNRMGDITIPTSGELTFDTTQSTYLKIRGKLVPNSYNSVVSCGSRSSPLSSSYTCTIEYDLASDGASEWVDADPSNGATISFHGASKTISEELSVTANASQADITFSTIPADWAVNDRVLILSSNTSARTTEVEERTISSIASNTATLDSNLTYQHSAGTVVLNLTRNIRFFPTTAANEPAGLNGKVQLDCSNVEWEGIGNSNWSNAGTQGGKIWYATGCTIGNMDGAVHTGDSDEGLSFKDCIFYNTGDNHFEGSNRLGSYTFNGCYFVKPNVTCIDLTGDRGAFLNINDCTFACAAGDGVNIGYGGAMINNSYFYNLGDNPIIIPRCTAEINHCFFGENPNGTSLTNGDASIRIEAGFANLNDCKFTDTDPFDTADNDTGHAGIYSSNHNQTANNYTVRPDDTDEYIIDDTTTYRTSSPSLQLDCERSGTPTVFRLLLPVDGTSSYTVTIYGKRSGTGWDIDPYATAVGCGIDDSSTWTTDDTNWNSITLTGTSSRAGIVLIQVFHLDNSGQFNIDDITVA